MVQASDLLAATPCEISLPTVKSLLRDIKLAEELFERRSRLRLLQCQSDLLVLKSGLLQQAYLQRNAEPISVRLAHLVGIRFSHADQVASSPQSGIHECSDQPRNCNYSTCQWENNANQQTKNQKHTAYTLLVVLVAFHDWLIRASTLRASCCFRRCLSVTVRAQIKRHFASLGETCSVKQKHLEEFTSEADNETGLQVGC